MLQYEELLKTIIEGRAEANNAPDDPRNSIELKWYWFAVQYLWWAKEVGCEQGQTEIHCVRLKQLRERERWL